jgi:2-polyprenyl-3-methyl-5-hydroxy-6-metoxy-1,4-benzoquinol methylase
MSQDTNRPRGHASDSEPTILATVDGAVEVLPLLNGRFKVTLKPRDRSVFVPLASCETSLPPDVIAAFLDLSFAWLCDSLARHDDPDYVQKVLQNQLLAYVEPSDFQGKRLLDFGCGSGASTLCMGTLLPDTEVVGIDLNPRNIALARRVLAVRQLSNVQFLVSSDPNSLAPGIGTFDFVVLSAVYEHLLPEERYRVMPLIWSSMNCGGVLFVSQTPYRYFPFEHHSTGLWVINYLPDKLSLFLARNLSKINPETNKSSDWTVHLRGGIRGATEVEILRNLRLSAAGRPTIIQPRSQDRAAYWLSCTNPERYRLLKKSVAVLFRLTDKLWGTVPSMNVDVAIRKDPA